MWADAEDRSLGVDKVAAVARPLGDKHTAWGFAQVVWAISYRYVARRLRGGYVGASRGQFLKVWPIRYDFGANKLKPCTLNTSSITSNDDTALSASPNATSVLRGYLWLKLCLDAFR